MKNQKLLIILLLLLVFIAVIFWRKNNTSLNKKDIDFKVQNFDKLTKIIIVNPIDTIQLEKKTKNWYVNQNFKANQSSIDLFLKSLTSIEIESPVSKKYHAQIIDSLTNRGMRILMYNDNILSLSYEVYTDNVNCYMTKQKSDHPYQVKIKGTTDYNINDFLAQNINFWRENMLINYVPEEITSISFLYPENKHSYTLKLTPNNVYIEDKEKIHTNTDIEIVSDYLQFYQNIHFQVLTEDESIEAQNACTKESFFFHIRIEDIYGIVNSVKGYKKENDPNHFYAMVFNNSEFVILNYSNFDPLLQNMNYFLKSY